MPAIIIAIIVLIAILASIVDAIGAIGVIGIIIYFVILLIPFVIIISIIGPHVARHADRQKKQQEKYYRDGKKMELEQEKMCIKEAERILKKHDDLVQKCFEITERKVSVVDDYGEENWSELPEQLNRMGLKIAEREGLQVKNGTIVVPSLQSTEFKIWAAVGNIAAIRFKKYHENIASRSSGAEADVQNMSGVEFETHIIRLLKAKGYEDIAGTPASGDQGADILAKKDGKKIVIQAKRYIKPVGNKAVQEVTAALRFYNADEAWVVTNATFTRSARALAHKNDVKLVDGTALATQAF